MNLRIPFAILAVTSLSACLDATAARNCDLGTYPPGPIVEVKFAERLKIRGCDKMLWSEVGANTFAIRQALDQIGVVQIRPSFTSDGLDSLYADAHRLSPGEPVVDLLSWHRLVLTSGADVDAAIAVLLARSDIEYAYQVSTVPPPPP